MPYAKTLEGRAKNTACQKKWYLDHRTEHKKRNVVCKNVRKRLFRDFVRKLKESKPCTDCGVKYPWYVMDFDHLRDKRYAVSTMSDGTVERAMREIEKCELVCANCHRKRTFSRNSVP